MISHDSQIVKAKDASGRFREIISDPLNLLIYRVPNAGHVHKNQIILHNGNLTALQSYYGRFSDILIYNRGVHEPLEEFCFQQMLHIMPVQPTMLELGSYWAHYSMWLLKARSRAKCILVEPDPANMLIGNNNLKINGYAATTVNCQIDSNMTVDRLLQDHDIHKLNILHSDIQGSEIQMINGANRSFSDHLIDYAFISTHSEDLHLEAIKSLISYGYNIDIDSNFSIHTTCYDGFILARSPGSCRFIDAIWKPLGRHEIVQSTPNQIFQYLSNTKDVFYINK